MKESIREIDSEITLGSGRQNKNLMKSSTPVRSRIQTITVWRRRGSLQDALGPLVRMLRGRLGAPLFFACAAVLVQPCAAQWEFTGSLKTARELYTATLLPDGEVLAAGGGTNGSQSYPNPYIKSAELYAPATGAWRITGSLNYVRSLHTATLLPSGKVLVAGGWPEATSTGTAELYDPATRSWTLTGNFNARHAAHTATLLFDGKVLVAGGSHAPSSAELYDPATGTWSLTGNLTTPRYGYHTATLLFDGRVLVAGGTYNLASAELYNPATGTWTSTGSLHTGRSNHTATLLLNGKVLVAGGMNQSFTFGALTSTELYDPATGTWTVTGDLNVPRLNHTATMLPDGKVLVAGGQGESTF